MRILYNLASVLKASLRKETLDIIILIVEEGLLIPRLNCTSCACSVRNHSEFYSLGNTMGLLDVWRLNTIF